MDTGFFEELILEGVQAIDVDDKTFYIKMPSALDGNFIEIMTDENTEAGQKMINSLALVLCNESGNLIFDINNDDHRAKIKSLPDKYLVPIIEAMQEMMFPSKKK